MSFLFSELEKASIQLMLKEPFFGHFLSGLVKQISDKTPSMSLGLSERGELRLLINETYWKTVLAPKGELQVNALKHQLLHLVFRHVTQGAKFGNRTLFNLSADLVVNPYLNTQHLQEGDYLPTDFKEFNLPTYAGLQEQYNMLLNQWGQMQNLVQQALQDEDLDLSGEAKSDAEEAETAQDEDALMTLFNPSQRLLWRIMKNPPQQLREHDTWADFEAQNNASLRLLDESINELLEASVARVKHRNYGDLPLSLQTFLEQFMQSRKPNLNWRRMLRMFAANSQKTYVKNTIRRASKRYGTTPGIQIKKKSKVLVALDTSGSITEQELGTFFSEVQHIWKQGVEVEVVECDVAIQQSYMYQGKQPKKVLGRGGTAFDAPIRYANERSRPDALIYFTDGFGPKPDVQARMPILWLIAPQGVTGKDWEHLPGRKIKMQD